MHLRITWLIFWVLDYGLLLRDAFVRDFDKFSSRLTLKTTCGHGCWLLALSFKRFLWDDWGGLKRGQRLVDRWRHIIDAHSNIIDVLVLRYRLCLLLFACTSRHIDNSTSLRNPLNRAVNYWNRLSALCHHRVRFLASFPPHYRWWLLLSLDNCFLDDLRILQGCCHSNCGSRRFISLSWVPEIWAWFSDYSVALSFRRLLFNFNDLILSIGLISSPEVLSGWCNFFVLQRWTRMTVPEIARVLDCSSRLFLYRRVILYDFLLW